MGEKKQKVAVIGTGYWGKNLVRVFSRLGCLSIVCDTDQNKLTRLKLEYPHVHTTLSYSAILKNPAIDAVVISTPAETHYSISKEAILSGKDVFVEKPLALLVIQGEELVELAHAHKRILMVGHLLEYHPAICKIKEFMKKGEFGKIQYIYSNRLNLGKIRREENILWSFAPHDISIVLLLLDEVPESVSSSGGNYLSHKIADVTLSILNFANGIKGHIFVSWLHPYKEQKLVIIGSKKMVVFDDVSEGDKVLVYSHKIDWIDRVPVPRKETATRIEFDPGEPLMLECAHFLECVHSRKMPKTDGKSALRVLRVLQACQESLKNNGTLINLSVNKPQARYYAHPSAHIEPGCQIGDGTKIWHYTHVMKGAKIGKNCGIGQNVFISSNAELGNYIKVQNNVSIYDGVKLEDGVFCGPSVVFTNVTNPRSNISRRGEFEATYVKSGATLGDNATIICGNTIGEYAFIGAGSVVTKSIPAYALVYGNPAAVKGWVCQCGAKMNFVKNTARCLNCGKKYLNKKEIVVLIKKEK